MDMTREQERAIHSHPEVLNARDGLEKARKLRDDAEANYRAWTYIFQEAQMDAIKEA